MGGAVQTRNKKIRQLVQETRFDCKIHFEWFSGCRQKLVILVAGSEQQSVPYSEHIMCYLL